MRTELLSLKVCDMAMRSAGILVEVSRDLVRAAGGGLRRVRRGELEGGESRLETRVLPDGLTFGRGLPTAQFLPTDAEERLIMARGSVSKSGLLPVSSGFSFRSAVDGKAVTIVDHTEKDRPFTFLTMRCGVPIRWWVVCVDQLSYWNMDRRGRHPSCCASECFVHSKLRCRRLRRRAGEDFGGDDGGCGGEGAVVGIGAGVYNSAGSGADQLVTSYFVSSKKSRQEMYGRLCCRRIGKAMCRKSCRGASTGQCAAFSLGSWSFQRCLRMRVGLIRSGSPPFQGEEDHSSVWNLL